MTSMKAENTTTKKRKVDNETDTDINNGESKSASSANKKRALMHERQSHRRHYEKVRKAKEIWNKLRVKNLGKKEMNEMVTELMTLFTGIMKEVVLKHDASRIVQALIQFGSTQQRKSTLMELIDDIPEMSKIQYAHFVVLKLIKYCARDDESRRLIIKSVKGSIPKLAVHAVGARVIEILFTTFPSKSIALLKQEMYGPKFAIFQTGDYSTASLSLKEIIGKHPESSSSALTYLLGVCDRGIEKGLFGFAYFQELLWEFMDNATPNQLRDMIPSLVDHSIHLLSTRAGAKVVAYCAAYGQNKDRRKIMKNIKGYTKSSLLHKDAYIAIIRLLDVTDDTVAIQKNILAELLSNENSTNEKEQEQSSPLLDIALSDTGCKFFFYLLTKANEKQRQQLLDPFELELLKPATILDKDTGEVVSTSKKNPETRQTELAQYMRQDICDLCAKHTEQLMRSKNGANVLNAVFQFFPSEGEKVANYILNVCNNSHGQNDNDKDTDDCDDDKDKKLSVFEDPIAHLLLKRLILAEVENDSSSCSNTENSSNTFSMALSKTYKGRMMEIASTNRGAFILSALVQIKHEDISKNVKDELKRSKHLKTLQNRKKEKGFEALLKFL